MKKNNLFIAAVGFVMLAVLASAGCKKDDTTPKSTITYDGKTYDITQGIMFYDTIVKNEVYGYYFLYLSDGFNVYWNDKNDNIDSITGTGEALELYLASSTSIDPADGTYNHAVSKKSLTETPAVSTWEGGAFIEYEIDGENGEENSFELISGTIDVKKTGTDQYEMKFNTTAETQKALTGYLNVKVIRGMELDKKGSGSPLKALLK